jgi:hypothetical protein
VQRQVVSAGLLCLFIAIGCKEARWTPVGSAELVLSEIKLRGAPAVSRRLDSDENFARSVLSGIATGDSTWLEVAARITPATSAAEASLAIALAAALNHAPERVLRLLGVVYPVEQVCGIPFLKADSGTVVRYYDSVTTTLARVSAVSERGMRDACMVALQEARGKRLERISPDYLLKNKPAPPKRPVKRKAVKPPQTVTPIDTTSHD